MLKRQEFAPQARADGFRRAARSRHAASPQQFAASPLVHCFSIVSISEMIVGQTALASNPRWRLSIAYMAISGCVFWRNSCPSKGGMLALPASNVNPLPSKKASVERPATRPDQCHGGAHGCQEDMCQPIPRLRERAPKLHRSRKRSHDGRPQTDNQKDSGSCCGEQVHGGAIERGPLPKTGDPTIN